MAGLFEDLIGGGIEVAGALDQINRTETLGQTAQETLSQAADEYRGATQFQPFTVASSTGNVSAGADGSLDATLSQPNQAAADAAIGSATGLFGEAGVPLDAATQSIFDSMVAATQPQYERDLAGLQAGLFGSGRSGITTGDFGGTPEEFAFRKAREEALANAFLGARAQAGTERNQAAAAGSQLINAGQVPVSTLFNQLNPAVNVANLGQTGQIAGANLGAQLDTAGIQTAVNAQKTANDLYAGLFGSAANLGGALGGVLDNAGAGDFVTDLIGSFF